MTCTKPALTTARVKEAAVALGLDLCGVANIERFAGAPARMSPTAIFPGAKSVIVVAKRIIRGGWRGIEEGTYWPSYSYFDYHGLLNSVFIPVPLYELACLIEDQGWEAVPYYPGVPEMQGPNEPLRPDAPAPNVHLAIRIAGLAAGLGELGWSKVFLTKEFGPRVRLAAIITDLELEPDPLMAPGTLCDRCMQCVSGCPGAIPHLKDGKTVSVTIEDTTYTWGDVDMGQCTLMYHGGDPRTSPFIHQSLPGYAFDVTKQAVSEVVAYQLCWTLSRGQWNPTMEKPSPYIIEGHAKLCEWGEAGSYGVEGSRGCMRSCFNHLEKKGAIAQTFHNGEFIKRPRWLLPADVPPRDAR
jgi:epoxyqueuosine reductase